MRIQVAIPDEHVNAETIDPVLEAVTRVNEHLVKSGQSPTSHELITAGARWRPENMGDEHFDHGATIAQRGWGDCDDWAPLHAATLRATGEDPGAIARVIPSGPSTFHAVVQRSSGHVELGDEDISARAGMKPMRSAPAVIGGADGIDVLACDPHDGRLYHGSLAPAVAPLSLHCGPQHAVRGCTVIGHGPLYEARVDLPISGSRLVAVRSYVRHAPHHRRKRVMGSMPFALSVSHIAGTPLDAFYGAVVGACVVGEASGMASNVDRYKLVAMQLAMQGLSPGQLRDALIEHIKADVAAQSAASGLDPRAHSMAILRELAAQGHVDGYMARVIGGVEVGSIWGDIAHAASGVVHAVKNVVAKVGPWVGTLIHGLQAIVSVIPGIGTVVSDVLATAESAYDEVAALASGNPLEGAIKAAYNYATSTIPGAAAIRFVLDPVVNTLLEMAFHKEPIESAVMNGVLNSVPDKPQIGPLSPKSVASSLAHLLVSHLGAKKTPPGAKVAPPPALPPGHAIMPGQAIAVHPNPAVHAAIIAKSHAAGRATPSKVVKVSARAAVKEANLLHPVAAAPAMAKPLGAAHAAMPAHPTSPPHPSAAPAPAIVMPSRVASSRPGIPPGATHWHCQPLPEGHWACSWQ